MTSGINPTDVCALHVRSGCSPFVADLRRGVPMQIPVETKPAMWGLAGGAIAMAIVGFTWGGWVTHGTAESQASERAKTAVVAALAPVCAEKFQRTADAPANL